MNTLPNKLLALRKKYGYSQSLIAEELEIEVMEYMAYENGRNVPDFMTLKKLAKLFKVDVDVLFDNTAHLDIEDSTSSNIDKKNYEYLTKQTKRSKQKEFLQKNKKIILIGIISAIIFLLVISLIIIGIKNENLTRVKMQKRESDILSVNDTNVYKLNSLGELEVYGDESNGHFNAKISDGFKVVSGDSFIAVLKKDGTIATYGLSADLTSTIAEVKDIVDISAGKGHLIALDRTGDIMCFGDNTKKQCEFEKDERIIRIFASGNASFYMDEEGKVYSNGEFIGRSRIANLANIIDIDTSDNIIAYVDKNGRIDYFSSGESFNECVKWTNIINVEVGNNYIAAIDSKGKVFIDTKDEKMAKTVESLEKIETIAGASDYLVFYDGLDIYGAGNNAYNQFKVKEVEKIDLASVTNVSITMDDNNLVLNFNPVIHASSYVITFDGANEKVVYTNSLTVPLNEFEDKHEYEIKIIAKAESEEYNDSLPTLINYLLKKPIIEKPEDKVVLGMLEGMPKDEFVSYLIQLGVDEKNIKGEELKQDDCVEDTIISVEGISSYQNILKDELAKTVINYKYCKVKKGD